MTRFIPALMLTSLACTEAPLPSEAFEDLGRAEQALCENGDGVPSALAALAVATAIELGRWEPTQDFRLRRGELRLTPAAKRLCDDRDCWNTQAILDLQHAPPGQVVLGEMAFDGQSFQRALEQNFEEQQRCEAGGRGRDHDDCRAERHELVLDTIAPGACDTVFTFHATTPRGAPLARPERLANRLIYAGYPENEYLSFASTGTTVSIDPTYGLNPGGDTSTGACTASCTKISATNITGQCCSCAGVLGDFARSAWSPTTYICQ